MPTACGHLVLGPVGARRAHVEEDPAPGGVAQRGDQPADVAIGAVVLDHVLHANDPLGRPTPRLHPSVVPSSHAVDARHRRRGPPEPPGQRAPALGAWGAPERASRGPEPAHSPDVAVNATGDAVATWVVGAPPPRADRRERPPGRRRSGARRRSISGSGRRAIDPQVAVDASGRIVVVWRQAVRTRTVRVRGVARRQAVYVVRARDKRVNDVLWGPVTVLSSDRQKVGPPELGIDDDGDAVATLALGHRHPARRARLRRPGPDVRAHAGRLVDDRAAPVASPLCRSVDDPPRSPSGARGHAVDLVAVRPDRRPQHGRQRQPRPGRGVRRRARAAVPAPSATCRPISRCRRAAGRSPSARAAAARSTGGAATWAPCWR